MATRCLPEGARLGEVRDAGREKRLRKAVSSTLIPQRAAKVQIPRQAGGLGGWSLGVVSKEV
ncbi:hypothetical protein, partial [Methylobacterium haplocladii]|uniref:hypothetical protein n=1 Tax=Methylobacterium haplocladii TaxID=1176176 RepID=UPI001EDD8727